MFLLLLVLIASVSGETSDQGTQTTKPASVGEAFKLTKVDVDGYVSGGKHLYSGLSETCFLDEDTPRYKKNYHVFSDREDLVEESGTDVTGQEIEKSPTDVRAGDREESHGHVPERQSQRQVGLPDGGAVYREDPDPLSGLSQRTPPPPNSPTRLGEPTLPPPQPPPPIQLAQLQGFPG